MSTAKPMTSGDREARYHKQNGRSELTLRQQRQIRKTTLRLEHGRHRKAVNRPASDRAIKGRKRAYADWLRDFYSSQLRSMRRQDRRAKLGRYTAGRQEMTADLRFCKCGHVEGTHWAGDAVEESLVGDALPYRCHAKRLRWTDCDCTKFRPKRNGSRVKRFLTRQP